MDIQNIIDQVTKAIGDNPSIVSELTSDPAKAIQDLTGHALEGADLESVVSGLTSGNGGSFDLAGMAENLMGDGIANAAEDLLGGILGNK